MLGMAATVFEPATCMMDVDYEGAATNATGSTTTGPATKKRTSSSLMATGSETSAHSFLYNLYSNKKATALFTRPACNIDDDLNADDMMEMADMAYFTHHALGDKDGAAFDDLPEELVYLIFTFLHGSDIANGVQKVCRNWRRLALDDQLWLDLLRRQQEQKTEEDIYNGLAVEELRKPAHKSWRWLYQSRNLAIRDLACIAGMTVVGRHESAEYIYEGEWKDGKHHGHGRKTWKNVKSESEAKEEHEDNANNANPIVDGAAVDQAAPEGTASGQPTPADAHQQSVPKRAAGAARRRAVVLPYYEGEWFEGKEHGKGKRLFEEDHYYEGDWKEGDREGFGFYHWPNKTFYEGEFKEGFRHGHGTYTWSEKAKYVGQWQKGIEHGKGVRSWADGDRYEGDWVHGTRTGYGLYSWPNGSSYEGKWLQCAHEGYGVYKWPDGRTYKGNFSANKKHGLGEYYWPDGAMFSGYWRNGVRHGQGTMLWPDQAKFEGEWHFDRRADGRYFSPEAREVPQTLGASWSKKYDYYFAMPMDMWEQIYLPEINKLIREKKQRELEEEESRRMEISHKGQEDPRPWGRHNHSNLAERS